MSESELIPHRAYWLKIGSQTISARIDKVRSVIDVNSFDESAHAKIGLNDVGRVVIDLDRPIPAVRYAHNRKLGGFILIDTLTKATVAGGLIDGFPAAPKLASQEPARTIRWVMGKRRSTWAAQAAERLRAQGHRVVILDHAALVAFGASDLTRVARQAAHLLAEAGAIVLVTLGAAPEEAYPGTCIDSETDPNAGEEWVI